MSHVGLVNMKNNHEIILTSTQYVNSLAAIETNFCRRGTMA